MTKSLLHRLVWISLLWCLILFVDGKFQRQHCAYVERCGVVGISSMPRGGGGNTQTDNNQDNAKDDFYTVLGFTSLDHHNPSSSPPSQQEIQQAYRRKSLELHPDKNKAPDATAQFMQLGQAYETLSDPIQRRHYDHELLVSRQRPNYKQQNQWHSTHQKPPSTAHFYRQRQRQSYDPWDEIRKEFTKFSQQQKQSPRTTDANNLYTYEDALRTFRSYWGLVETTLGKTQIAAIMYRTASPFTMTTTGRTTPSLFATTAAYVITTIQNHNHPNSRSNNKHDTRHPHYYYHHQYHRQRDELRRTIDTTLQVLVPMLLGTLGTDRTAQLVGRTSLVFGVVAGTLFLVPHIGYVVDTTVSVSRPLKLRGVAVTILGIGVYGALVLLFKQYQQQHHVKHTNTNTNRHRRDTKEEEEEEEEEEA